MIIIAIGKIKTTLGFIINAAPKRRKYKRKKRLDEIPPVEKMKRRRTEFSKKKISGPPKLRLCLFLIEIIKNIKTKKPIAGTVKA